MSIFLNYYNNSWGPSFCRTVKKSPSKVHSTGAGSQKIKSAEFIPSDEDDSSGVSENEGTHY